VKLRLIFRLGCGHLITKKNTLTQSLLPTHIVEGGRNGGNCTGKGEMREQDPPPPKKKKGRKGGKKEIYALVIGFPEGGGGS